MNEVIKQERLGEPTVESFTRYMRMLQYTFLTFVGTSYVKTSCSGIIKFYVPPEIHVQEPKIGGRVKRLTVSSLISSKYSLDAFHVLMN
ncbi:hypothetical protein GQ457_10G012260 [Hibiscus cannabinus]